MSELDEILDILVQKTGKSVTDNYSVKNGLWEGKSVSIAGFEDKAKQAIKALIKREALKARIDEYTGWLNHLADCLGKGEAMGAVIAYSNDRLEELKVVDFDQFKKRRSK